MVGLYFLTIFAAIVFTEICNQNAFIWTNMFQTTTEILKLRLDIEHMLFKCLKVTLKSSYKYPCLFISIFFYIFNGFQALSVLYVFFLLPYPFCLCNCTIYVFHNITIFFGDTLIALGVHAIFRVCTANS